MLVRLGDLRTALAESRPTPIDKPAAVDLVQRLLARIEAKLRSMPGSEPVGDDVRLAADEHQVADVRGRYTWRFPVVVTTVVDPSNDDPVAGAGAGRVEGRFAVIVDVNGRYPPERLLGDLGHVLARNLYTTLLHELTHAADHAYDTRPSGQSPRYVRTDGSVDDDRYFNDPREVRAFVQEAVEEALDRAQRRPDLRGQGLIGFCTSGPVVSMLQRKMGRRALAKVMKAVHAALQDAGRL